MLGAPEIQGKLSECSRGVQFNQLVVGATVELQTTAGAQIGQWTVGNATQSFDFAAGKVLKAGMAVQAVQLTSTEAGQLSLPVNVNGRPSAADLSVGAFAKPLFECGECVWLFDMFAGADVVVANHLDDIIGKGVVGPDGSVEVGLSRPLTVKDNLTATLTACASMGGKVKSATPILGGTPMALLGLTLPQTQILPVKQCANFLYIEKIMNGASIELTRTPKGGLPTKFAPLCIPTAPFTLWGFAPFQRDEVLVIETDLHACKKPVGTKVVLTVEPGPPGIIVILDPICTDSPTIDLDGLEINALIEVVIHHPGTPTTIHWGASKTQDSYPLAAGNPPRLVQTAGAVITVRQNLCGGPGDWSASSSATVQAGAAPAPKLFTPYNMEANVSLPTFLSWTEAGSPPCSQASSYDLRVSKAKGMGPADLVFAPKLPIIFHTLAVPSGILKAGTTYFWQVRAYHSGNPTPSGWSAIFQFSTLTPRNPPPPPSGNQTFYFCETCPGLVTKPFSVIAPDYSTAEFMASKQVPTGCFAAWGKCS